MTKREIIRLLPKNSMILHMTCTDWTGKHHSTLIYARSLRQAKEVIETLYDHHITRIEELDA